MVESEVADVAICIGVLSEVEMSEVKSSEVELSELVNPNSACTPVLQEGKGGESTW
jgi:hypothetical protein